MNKSLKHFLIGAGSVFELAPVRKRLSAASNASGIGVRGGDPDWSAMVGDGARMGRYFRSALAQFSTIPEDVNEQMPREGALSGADLRGVDLSYVDFTGMDLSHANLKGAKLRGAILRGVNLEGANLEGADLRGVNLEGANLRGANLRGANLGADEKVKTEGVVAHQDNL